MTDRAGEQLVADYLRRLEAALADASPDRRRELLEEIAAHVEAARAALPAGGDELAVRDLLDRIGEPGEIAAAALAEDGAPVDAGTPGDAPYAALAAGSAAPHGAPGETAAHTTARAGVKEGLALPLLLLGGVVVPFFGWFAGVALLWWSKVWSTRDKAIGTFALPFGLLPAVSMSLTAGEVCSAWSDEHGRVVEQCTGGGTAPIPTLVFFGLLVLIPLATSLHLLLRLRTRRPAEPAGGVARSAPA